MYMCVFMHVCMYYAYACVHTSSENNTVWCGVIGDLKKLALVEKYQEMKTSGKLDKFMTKRRKKNSAKDRRFMARQD